MFLELPSGLAEGPSRPGGKNLGFIHKYYRQISLKVLFLLIIILTSLRKFSNRGTVGPFPNI